MNFMMIPSPLRAPLPWRLFAEPRLFLLPKGIFQYNHFMGKSQVAALPKGSRMILRFPAAFPDHPTKKRRPRGEVALENRVQWRYIDVTAF